MADPARRPRWTPGRILFWSWLGLLAASHLVRLVAPFEPRPAADETVAPLTRINGGGPGARPVRLAYRYWPAPDPDSPVVVVLHGSPGDNGQVRPLAEVLARRYRVLAPDLPGFGGSERRIPDYSIRSHADYVWQLLDSLGVGQAHLVGYSMGGGVAIEMADARPEDTRSLVLVSSIGVQEFELLGDYLLNHAVHGLQLGTLWTLRELVPHFGWMDDVFLGVEYARNFYDSDQRPLREMLSRWAGPALVVQGSGDKLVHPAIATEHGRIVPQAEIRIMAGGHFMVFTRADTVGTTVAEFVLRAERSEAPRRSTAEPARLAASAQPFDPATIPRPAGFSLFIVLFLLGASTLISEDLACIAAGLLVSRGTIGFGPAALACLIGIAVGDLLLFLAGRLLGRPALRHPPLKWLVSEADVERSSRWFRARGLKLVLATRFMPGTRLPTYVAAGVLRTSIVGFTIAFFIASAIWTPLLVGVSALAGGRLMEWIAGHEQVAGPLFVGGLLTLFFLVQLSTRLATWRGRRLLLSRWRRLTRWEFWPAWAVYPPIVAWILWLGIRHRSLTLFTAANPAIPGGGLAGESKAAILDGLSAGSDRVAPHQLVPANLPQTDRLAILDRFLSRPGIAWPIVLKPDVGERGSGVFFAADRARAAAYLEAAGADVLLQARVEGHEFGVFHVRMPGEPEGLILSITDKRFPTVIGDGQSPLERLILADDRAVCSPRWFLAEHAAWLDWVPAPGEQFQLTALGTHSRGALFLDGGTLATHALRDAMDRLADGYPGFHLGRYDVMAPSAEALADGGPFTVLELNGVSSEPTGMYDPKHGLLHAWRLLARQWTLAFEIGRRNRSRGARPATLRELLNLLRRHRAATAAHVNPADLAV